MKAIEAMFAVKFGAIQETLRSPEEAQLRLWPLSETEYDGLCRHSPLKESFSTAKPDVSPPPGVDITEQQLVSPHRGNKIKQNLGRRESSAKVQRGGKCSKTKRSNLRNPRRNNMKL